MRIADIVAALIGMSLSIAAFVFTFTFKHFKNVPVGPEFFPRWLAAGLFVCCSILLVQNIMHKDESKKAPAISPKNKDIQRVLIGFVLIIVTAVLWRFVGFLVTTPFSLFLLMRILGKRNTKIMILISIFATALIFFAFRLLLGIEMPTGSLDIFEF